LIPPLFLEAWQEILSCVFVAGVTLAAGTVRSGSSVKSEFFYFAVRSILIGALLMFFAFEAIHVGDSMMMLRRPRASGSSGWANLPQFLLAWPILSVFVFGVTAGDAPSPQPQQGEIVSNPGPNPL
jgi:hypothetical protein